MKKYLGIAAAALVSMGVMHTTPASAVPTQWTTGTGANGHYYEFITGSFSFADALAGAAAQTHLGLTGHLVTITSSDEQSFLNGLTGGFTRYYIAASDAAIEGEWQWVAGPETGSIFQIGGAAQPGFYTNWASGEPNNLSGEHYVLANWSTGGTWNDGTAGGPLAYVVEFSVTETIEMPAPGVAVILGLAIAGLGIARRKRAV